MGECDGNVTPLTQDQQSRTRDSLRYPQSKPDNRNAQSAIRRTMAYILSFSIPFSRSIPIRVHRCSGHELQLD